MKDRAADVGNQVAGVLLAAGQGTRMGTPKALVELGGRRLVDRGAELLRDGGTDPVLVVTGAAPVTVPGVIGVASSMLSALARAITSSGSEISAGVILFVTSAAA